MPQLPVIGITIGDVNGIGPEIILKSLPKIDYSRSVPVIFSSGHILKYYADYLHLNYENMATISNLSSLQNNKTHVFETGSGEISIHPGQINEQSGALSMASIREAISSALSNKIDAIVTAPISKEAVNLAGFHIPGHTEYLAECTQSPSVLMLLVHESLRVALVTGHIPVSEIAGRITKNAILQKAGILHQSLKSDFGISHPKIAVLGLNPHAGDGGVIGREEQDIIIPAVHELKKAGLNAEGPFPADGFFGQKLYQKYDGVLAMYHDQGLAPFKLLSFGNGVNFTAGLPIIRTSPDHGTAFNIAGKGEASPSSFLQAYNLAVLLAEKRIRESRK